MQIKPHKLYLNYSQRTPRHWLNGNIFGTHLLNSFHLLFPGSERYFIRTIKKFTFRIENEILLNQIKGFAGQENLHALEHEKFCEVMRAQGYKIDSFLNFFNLISFEFLEKIFGDNLNLAITAGLEHFTATLADIGIEGNLFLQADSAMRDLFEWHAAEELEHKSVAFDTLKAVNDNYPLRITGFLMATGLLVGFSSMGIIVLTLQDKMLLDKKVWMEAFDLFFGRKVNLAEKGLIAFTEYFELDFHPSNRKNSHLVDKVFTRLEEENKIRR